MGKAAELLDMSQVRFQRLIAERGICVHYDVAEFREDVAHLTAKGFRISHQLYTEVLTVAEEPSE